MTLDGVERSLDDLPSTRPTDGHVVTIQGRGGTTSYAITASSIEKRETDEVDFRVDYGDVHVAFGTETDRWSGTWAVSGEILDFQYRGVKPAVRIDGEERDVDSL